MARPFRQGALLLAAAGHAALLWPLLASPDQPPRLATAPVMTVSLLAPAPAAAPPQPAPPVPPVPVTKPRPAPAPPVRATPVVPAEAPARPSEPVAAVPAATPPAPAAPPAAALAPAAPATPAPADVPAPPSPALVEARFDAAYLDNPKPAYPPLARRLGEEGQVLLRAYVSADGKPEQIELRRSSGSARLDAAAQETVRRWRFVPARRGDTPTAAWVLIPINFRLES